MIIHNFAGSSSQLCSHGFHMEITAILRPLTFDGGIHAGPSPDIRRQHGRPDCHPDTWVPRRNPLSHYLFPAYYPGRIKASVNETLFLFLFRCEKCHKPITAWSRAPKPATLEEAEKHVLPLHCVRECGWSSAKMGSEAIASWAVPWHHQTEK